jgi:hypothetical protein
MAVDLELLVASLVHLQMMLSVASMAQLSFDELSKKHLIVVLLVNLLPLLLNPLAFLGDLL